MYLLRTWNLARLPNSNPSTAFYQFCDFGQVIYTSLGLSLHMYKMGTTTVPTSNGCYEDE